MLLSFQMNDMNIYIYMLYIEAYVTPKLLSVDPFLSSILRVWVGVPFLCCAGYDHQAFENHNVSSAYRRSFFSSYIFPKQFFDFLSRVTYYYRGCGICNCQIILVSSDLWQIPFLRLSLLHVFFFTCKLIHVLSNYLTSNYQLVTKPMKLCFFEVALLKGRFQEPIGSFQGVFLPVAYLTGPGSRATCLGPGPQWLDLKWQGLRLSFPGWCLF